MRPLSGLSGPFWSHGENSRVHAQDAQRSMRRGFPCCLVWTAFDANLTGCIRDGEAEIVTVNPPFDRSGEQPALPPRCGYSPGQRPPLGVGVIPSFGDRLLSRHCASPNICFVGVATLKPSCGRTGQLSGSHPTWPRRLDGPWWAAVRCSRLFGNADVLPPCCHFARKRPASPFPSLLFRSFPFLFRPIPNRPSTLRARQCRAASRLITTLETTCLVLVG